MNQSFEVFVPKPDPALDEVAAELKRLDPEGVRWAAVIRHTYDMIYNGQESGRYRWDQLMKTEKTHFGTVLEINAQREFEFEDGDKTDYRIAGHQVDAKWSQDWGKWMLPPEVFGELALVVTASDEKSVWSLGLIRITADVRHEKDNRDKKSRLNKFGRDNVAWVWMDAPLRPNVLLQLPESIVEDILDHPHGTQRTHRLFRATADMIVHRNIVATVGHQLDPQKRVRYNGGSRSALQPEGIIILSGLYHRQLAEDLGIAVPLQDEYISVRVTPSTDATGAVINGRRWRRARPDEAIDEPAPIIEEPRRGDRNS